MQEKQAEQLYQELIASYLDSPHRKKVDVIQKAYNFACRAHEGVSRPNGEPYIIHPLEVALIVSREMGLGSTSICAALLHDIIENTDYTVEDIENIFGAKIAQIVDGLTKISGGIFGDKASEQAENFKKLLLTMSDDIRVILVKICDRLQNMRTLDNLTDGKKTKVAGETLYLYAPLANRLGLNKIKTELEDLAFRYEHPDSYENICKKLAHTQEQRDELFAKFTTPIREALDAMGCKYVIKMRVKSPYSIWNKMRNKHVSFDEIYDILAVRIIFEPPTPDEEVNECFRIYVALTKLYKSHPDRLRDWLSHPKANGYQALHVTLMSNQGRWIEAQIRSKRMDEIAEQGFAAHWKYKEGTDEPNNEGELNDWLCTIKEILDDPQPDAMDFLDAIKLNLFASEIFVFSPKGEIITLPSGATALDFAFYIHTFLGSHCIGAKVNHKLVPLSHVLQGGDQVEIITSNSQHVQPEWISFVTTAKARNKIQTQLRRANRDTQQKGLEMLREWLKSHDLNLTTSTIRTLCEAHGMEKQEHLLLDIGNGTITLSEKDLDHILGVVKKNKKSRWRRFVPFLKSKNDNEEEDGFLIVQDGFDKDRACVISEDNINKYVFSHDCCHPIPGDDVIGYIDGQDHIELHHRSCQVVNRLRNTYAHRILAVRWNMHNDNDDLLFDAVIVIKGIDRKGIARDVALVIADQMDINIHKLSISSDKGIFEGRIEMRVHDREELTGIIDALKKIPDLTTVIREY